MVMKSTPTRSRRRPDKRQLEEDIQPSLSPETRRGITTVVFFVVAVVLILSLFGLAGAIGGFLDTVITYLFGWGRFISPILFLFLGAALLFPDRLPLRGTNILGFVLLILSYSAILHLWISLDEALIAIPQGRGGGYFGYVLSFPFQKLMGFWATIIVLIALTIIGLLLLLNTSLERLLRRRGLSLGALGRLGQAWRREDSLDDEVIDEPMTDEGEGDENDDPELTVKEVPGMLRRVKKMKASSETAARRPMRKIDLPLELLDKRSSKPVSGDITAQGDRIHKTLENFNISVEMGDVQVGPTVTQYTLRPADGVKLSQITSLTNDLSLALAAHPIRIEAPIPGKSLVGIEVPNEQVAVVSLREVLESEEFKRRPSNLTMALGKDVSGRSMIANIDSMPHLLIAGATGSGKSVAINTLVLSLLYQNGPDDLKFILVDPKKVELTAYNDIPHLLTPVITEVDKTINALKWVVNEMDRRYRLLAGVGKKNIRMYNGSVLVKLPYIVIIIDELADLMSVAAADVERIIIRLAQMARAVGIHLVLSTQRPSVDVITGLIKANITSRIAFAVASLMDSRTILDHSGAEKLLGRGDMLFSSAELSKPKRIQGAYITEEEIERVVEHIKSQAKPDYINEVTERVSASGVDSNGEMSGEDDLLEDAKELVWRAQKASASLLQRHLRVGYARAARILDLLEEQGIIGPGDGAKPREILVQKDEFADSDQVASTPLHSVASSEAVAAAPVDEGMTEETEESDEPAEESSPDEEDDESDPEVPSGDTPRLM